MGGCMYGRATQFPFPRAALGYAGSMPEIADFVRRGSSRITPRNVKVLLPHLPILKAEFSQIHAPKFPHLVEQLNFLVEVVEDFAEGEADDIPYKTAAEAAFALLYAHRGGDLIPDLLPELGRADDSSVVRAVLIRHEADLRGYAAARDLDWNGVTSNP